MSILNKVLKPAQQRGARLSVGKYAGVVIGGLVALKLPAMMPQGGGVAVIAGLASIAIWVLAQHDSAKTVGPTPGKLRLITLTMVGGIGYETWTAIQSLGNGMDRSSRLGLIGLLVVAEATA